MVGCGPVRDPASKDIIVLQLYVHIKCEHQYTHRDRDRQRDRGKDKYVSVLEERKPFLKSDDLLRRLASHRHLAVLMVSVSR